MPKTIYLTYSNLKIKKRNTTSAETIKPITTQKEIRKKCERNSDTTSSKMGSFWKKKTPQRQTEKTSIMNIHIVSPRFYQYFISAQNRNNLLSERRARHAQIPAKTSRHNFIIKSLFAKREPSTYIKKNCRIESNYPNSKLLKQQAKLLYVYVLFRNYHNCHLQVVSYGFYTFEIWASLLKTIFANTNIKVHIIDSIWNFSIFHELFDWYINYSQNYQHHLDELTQNLNTNHIS